MVRLARVEDNEEQHGDAFKRLFMEMQEVGGELSQWYCGVTCDLNHALQSQNVITNYISYTAKSSSQARWLLGAFATLGCRALGRIDLNGMIFYADRLSMQTRPWEMPGRVSAWRGG